MQIGENKSGDGPFSGFDFELVDLTVSCFRLFLLFITADI